MKARKFLLKSDSMPGPANMPHLIETVRDKTAEHTAGSLWHRIRTQRMFLNGSAPFSVPGSTLGGDLDADGWVFPAAVGIHETLFEVDDDDEA